MINNTQRVADENKQWSFISDFNCEYKEVESIFSKHWHILMMDKALKTVLPVKSSFIYRKAPNFGDNIVQKIIDPPLKLTF